MMEASLICLRVPSRSGAHTQREKSTRFWQHSSFIDWQSKVCHTLHAVQNARTENEQKGLTERKEPDARLLHSSML